MSKIPADDKRSPGRFQFRLIELFVFTTAFCIAFAVLGQLGWQELGKRLIFTFLVVAPLVFVIIVVDFFHWLGR